MDGVERIVNEVNNALVIELGKHPDTPEARSALISVLVTLATGLAEHEPEPVRQHWAKFLYRQADRLAAPSTSSSE